MTNIEELIMLHRKATEMLKKHERNSDLYKFYSRVRKHFANKIKEEKDNKGKCKICGKKTSIIFGIMFKATPICEPCASSIFSQQAMWYIKNAPFNPIPSWNEIDQNAAKEGVNKLESEFFKSGAYWLRRKIKPND